ncbi:5'-nucleotidase C-terminal domain-containing protein [Halanaerobiaceae bacterium Z-7014]|uniref:5'-nucleotidase C-terminal domain-containing protein n=1 Tax=Halonatronomonas betaini TaxID=2778430 RepID=A0A931ARS9_9FIRM|nr:5'-nucleotidase [Halonatronomonas betaini]MBF8437782.1 5'-nucleotidase C-terminal domain-containing protein [Halonatronomonas betaini]
MRKRNLGIIVVALVLAFVFTVGQAQALDTEIGETEILLVGAREHVRTNETNLANMITDMMRDLTGADIAITNGGGIRDSVDVGPITLEDALDIHPFENVIVTQELTGEQLWAALENGVSQFPEHDGRFLQVSGIRFAFDPAEPSGERVQWVHFDGEDLDMDATYVVATNDFMASGGDEFDMLEEAGVLEEFVALDEALIDHFQENSPVQPRVTGRITILE